jgi:hypothetical protein
MFEVPISYYGRTYEQGKKIGMKDGLAALWYLVRYNLLLDLRHSYRTIPDLKQPKPLEAVAANLTVSPEPRALRAGR